MAITAIGITVTGIVFKQAFFRMLPLYVSLFISLLQTRVSRYAPLIGGINSILYAMVFLHYDLFGNAVYAVAFSCPVQILTFLRWSRNKWKDSTLLKKMNTGQRWLTVLAFALVWSAVLSVLHFSGSDYAVFDTTTSLLGILISILTMLAYIEYASLMVISGIASIGLYVGMIADGTLEQMPYLVYSIYSFVCICFTVCQAKRLFSMQRALKEL